MPNKKKQEILKQKVERKKKISNARAKRESLMLKLSSQLRESKLKESKLKKEILADASKEKSKAKTSKEIDKISIEKQKQSLNDTRYETKAVNSTMKMETKVIKNKMREDFLSSKRKHNEAVQKLKLERENYVAERKEKQNIIKVENLEKKSKLLEKQEKQKLALEKKKTKRQEDLSILKEDFITKKNNLKNMRNEQRMLAQAKRQEKTAKAQKMREDRIRMKADAKEQAREELAKAKLKHVEDAIDHEKELQEIKTSYEKEFDKIENKKVSAIKEDEQSVIEFREEPSTDVVVEEQAFVPSTDSSFFEDYVEDEVEEDEQEESYLRVEARVMSSYGKAGLRKARRAGAKVEDTNLNAYNKQPLLLESIEEFRKRSSNAISMESLSPYIKILLEQEISKEGVSAYVNNIFAAILLGYTLRLGDGYLSSIKVRGNNQAIYTIEPNDINNVVVLVEEEINDAINDLVSRKITSGGDIKIGESLMLSEIDGEITVLQNTNFTKA